jgi:hypothetical protein
MSLTQKTAQELFNYDPETGNLYWKRPTGARSVPGSIVGTLNFHGYYTVGIFGKKYKVHRIIWLYVYGYTPEHELDHINRIKTDNRISNLREVSHQCNLRNAKQHKSNTSGVTGINFDRRTSSWGSWITIDSKSRFLGRYSDYTEAVCIRLAVEQCLDWSSCEKNSSARQYIKDFLSNNK